MRLWLDLETYSPIPIANGVYKYAEDVEIMLIAWAIDDEPVQVWDVTDGSFIPMELFKALKNPECPIIAHNSNFDRTVPAMWEDFRHPSIPDPSRWHDTMVSALRHGLPGHLGQLCDVFGLPTDKAKDKDGKRLINLFCKPLPDNRKLRRATSKTHPDDWNRFKEYARLDVEAMREVARRLPTWNDTEFERQVWVADQHINDRGFKVDLDLARAAIDAIGEEQQRNRRRTIERTDMAVGSATQRDTLLAHLREVYDVDLPDLQTATITKALEDDLPEPARELLMLRLASSGTAVSKYKVALRSAGKDGRIRGTLQYSGAARTMRWGGRLIQPQNFPRPSIPAHEVEVGIEAIKAGTAGLLTDNVTELATNALRGLIVAPPGKKLLVADYSSIEGRVLAWLAGEEWKLQAYRDIDTGVTPYDMYVLTYATTFGKDPKDVDKKERQQGKVLELAMGYGGGVGSYVTFARGYGINLEEMAITMYDRLPRHTIEASEAYLAKCVEEHRDTYGLSPKAFTVCDAIKRMWRQANPHIISMWYDLEDAYRNAILGVKTDSGMWSIDKKGSWVRVLLPSGRYVNFAGAKVRDGSLTYMGVEQFTRRWKRLDTYGGRIAENLTQAAARDVLAHGMVAAEDHGFPVVLSVHDELICESVDRDYCSVERLVELMTKDIPWADGLPLAAAGFECKRYRKE